MMSAYAFATRCVWPMTPNNPVNPDARGSVVPCIGRCARAGYWERYASKES